MKHVIEDDNGTRLDGKLHRFNTFEGSQNFVKVDFSKLLMFTHPDSHVDLAIILQYPHEEKYNYLLISAEYFTNDTILNEKNIREGSKIFLPDYLDISI